MVMTFDEAFVALAKLGAPRETHRLARLLAVERPIVRARGSDIVPEALEKKVRALTEAVGR